MVRDQSIPGTVLLNSTVNYQTENGNKRFRGGSIDALEMDTVIYGYWTLEKYFTGARTLGKDFSVRRISFGRCGHTLVTFNPGILLF